MTQLEANPVGHWLLTALGTRPVLQRYKLSGRTASADHAPLALLELLDRPRRPGAVLCLVTPQARTQTWPLFSDQVEKLGLRAEALEVDDGDSPEQVATIIQATADSIDQGVQRLTLDITHGPRHFPFVFYALALYLSGFREVEINGVWFGKSESVEEEKPLINLYSLLELPKWFHAVQVFGNGGQTLSLAQRFDRVQAALPEGPERGPAKKAGRALKEFSSAYESALPLELGLVAGTLCRVLASQPLERTPGLDLPLAGELGDAIHAAASPLRIAQDGLRDGSARGEWKARVALTKHELQRQAVLVDCYMSRKQFPMAFGLMREWVVSFGVFTRGDRARWLERGPRVNVERELGCMAQPGMSDYLNDAQKQWGRFWDRLGKQRNQLAHHGMKVEVAKPDFESIKGFWDDIKSTERPWPTFGGGDGRLLITPLGMSNGVLYSAIKNVQPDKVLVLCSPQSKSGICQGLEHSAYTGTCEQLVMADPFNGVDEIAPLLRKSRKLCLGADEVLVNLSGGTAMMGVVVQRLYEQACNDQRLCRRFVLADRRSAGSQKRAPWVVSDLTWLDEAGE